MMFAAVPQRLLTAAEAAAYCKLKVRPFERLRIGRVVLGTTVRYDRFALDAHLDALSGLTPQSPPSQAADPEAALDRFIASSCHDPRRP